MTCTKYCLVLFKKIFINLTFHSNISNTKPWFFNQLIICHVSCKSGDALCLDNIIEAFSKNETKRNLQKLHILSLVIRASLGLSLPEWVQEINMTCSSIVAITCLQGWDMWQTQCGVPMDSLWPYLSPLINRWNRVCHLSVRMFNSFVLAAGSYRGYMLHVNDLWNEPIAN
jgi:hypothetical protein